MHKFVLTGQSSCGKTSTLNELKRRGYDTIDEIARSVLNLGLKDISLNQHIMMYSQIKEEAERNYGSVFIDRGVGDYIGFSNALAVDIPKDVLKSSPGRYDKIFSLDSLPDFEVDGTRIESNSIQSKRFYSAVRQQYKIDGYEIIDVPVMPIKERVDYILQNI